MSSLKGLIVLAVSNLIIVQIWLALGSSGLLPRYWINLLILGAVVALDYFIIRMKRTIMSAQEARFIRHHVWIIVFLSIIVVGATNSIITISIGKGKTIPDGTNVLVGLILVPLIVSILKRNWRHLDGPS